MVIMTPCTGDQLYPRRPTVSPNRPSLTVLIFPFGFFSYHQEYFQIINMTADYFGCKRTCVPMGKGHPEEPSGLYRKAAQHFEVLGTSRRKRGLELELAKKKLLLTTTTIHPAVQTVSIQQSSMVVLRHLGIIVKGKDDKRDASHVTMCETGVKRSLPSSMRAGGSQPK